ncbi:MAG TPA: UDP-N-acetylmuramoyl-L-alanine--D-glutamate ligase [Acidimicrobiales bacterium]|nr:UDP-N-acetylmuramoyl-L-alanine--D-glutamate ligase [Acidimicrobiales bacterium]
MTTPPKISWSDLRGARVGLFGLGVEGRANLARLTELSTVPVLVDDRPPSATVEGLDVLASAAGGLDALAACEVVVKSPGISRHRPDVVALEAAGVAVAGGLGLWMEEVDRTRVVCVTGTKGKSTTAALCGHLLEGLGYRAAVTGNIGRPPWDPGSGPDPEVWVVETSSFQATDLASAPPVVAVTSLDADHLDWHGDAETYVADKLSMCRRPGAELTVAADGAALRRQRARLGPTVRWVDLGDPELDGGWTGALGLLGAHNHRNALVARAVLVALGARGASDEAAVAAAAAGFAALESRLRLLGCAGGVAFYDDSLATNVLPTVVALEALGERRVALIVGGHDRGIDYRPLAEALARRAATTFVVTLPANGPRIHETIDALAGPSPEVLDAGDLDAAVARAAAWARPDGAVLLSPAAPSFGQFADYRDRSAAFAEAAARCGALAP